MSALLLLLLSLWQPCDGVHMLPCTSRRQHDDSNNSNMTMGRPMAAANAGADLLAPSSPPFALLTFPPTTASYFSWLKITTNATLRGTAHHPVVHVKPTTYQHCALTSSSVSTAPAPPPPTALPSPALSLSPSWAAGGHNGRQQLVDSEVAPPATLCHERYSGTSLSLASCLWACYFTLTQYAQIVEALKELFARKVYFKKVLNLMKCQIKSKSLF